MRDPRSARDDAVSEFDSSEWPRGAVRSPPPWILRGDAFIAVTASPTELNLSDAGISAALRGIYHNLFNAVIVADYRESPFGPFREIVYIPGRFRYGLEERLSVSVGYNNNDLARIHRRAYFGVTTHLAQIRRTTLSPDVDAFSVGDDPFARFSFETFGPHIALNARVLPRAFRTFAQLQGDRTLEYTFSVTGTTRAARFSPDAFDPAFFPDMRKREFVVGLKVHDFLGELPVPESIAWTTA